MASKRTPDIVTKRRTPAPGFQPRTQVSTDARRGTCAHVPDRSSRSQDIDTSSQLDRDRGGRVQFGFAVAPSLQFTMSRVALRGSRAKAS
jgi:hypothetical protein